MVVWAFGKSYGGKSLGWFSLYYGSGKQNIISYQIHNKDYYSAIKANVNTYKMKTLDSGIEENRIYSIHEGINYVVKLVIESEEQKENTIYHVNLFHKETYNSIEQVKYLKIYNELLAEYYTKEQKEKENIERIEREKLEEQQRFEKEKERIDELIRQGYSKVNTGTILYTKDMKRIIQVYSKTYAKILNKQTELENYYYVEYKGFKGYVSKYCFE